MKKKTTSKLGPMLDDALAEHNAGAVKTSGFMTGAFIFGLTWIPGSLVFMASALFLHMEKEFAVGGLLAIFASIFIGVSLFVSGWLRRYRYKLGKPVERVGLGVLVCVLLYAGTAYLVASKLAETA